MPVAGKQSVPEWALSVAGFVCVTRTYDELSIILSEAVAPPGLQSEPCWRIFKLEGPFEFTALGILAAVANPLKDAGVSILAVSTYEPITCW